MCVYGGDASYDTNGTKAMTPKCYSSFYMMPKTPTPDANEWCWKAARELGLITVPGDSFECPGHFRISYCVPTEMIEKAIPLFEKAFNF